MTNADKKEKLDTLYIRLDNICKDCKQIRARQNLRREIKELKQELTTEDYERLMKDNRDIDVNKCR